MILPLTSFNFHQVVETSSLPVLVLFGAPWCAPCKRVKPVVEELSNELQENLVVGYVDGERDGSLAQEEGVRGFPTVILYREGSEVDRIMGVVQKARMVSWLHEKTQLFPV